MEIIGGTWGPSKISFGHSFFGGKLKSTQYRYNSERLYRPTDVDTVQILHQGNNASLGRGVMGSVIGTAVAGPIGLIAGAVIGSHKHMQTILITFKDGNQIFVSGKPKEMKIWFELGRLMA